MRNGRPRGVFASRRTEMSVLGRAFSDVRGGHGQIVLVSGEAGVGKTRLAEEFAGSLEPKSATVVWGRCHPGQTSPTYWPWTQIVDAFADTSGVATLRRLLGSTAQRLAAISPLVGERLRLPAASLAAPERFQLFTAVQTLLGRAARQTPVVLVLEDLHWADLGSLLLLEVIAQGLRGHRILVLATYRDDEVQARLAQAIGELARVGVTRLALRGLSLSGTARLMTTTAGRELPSELVAQVHTRTGGNPFFVTEIARLRSADVHAIPDSVRAVIDQRQGRLSVLAQELLAVAAVIGPEFELRIVAPVLSEVTGDRLLRALGEVLDAALAERGSTHDAYRFKHELIRDAIYESIDPGRRAEVHAALLHVLERLYAPALDDHAAELAAHAAQAELLVGSPTVVDYSRRAGEQKLAAHAFEEALPHFERAWRARNPLPLDAEAAAILSGLGCAQAGTALRWNRQEGWDSLRRAVGYYLDVGDVGRAVATATQATIVPEAAAGVSSVIEPMLTAVARGSREEGWLRARLGAALYLETADRARTRAAFDRAHELAQAHDDQPLELRTAAYETSIDHFDLKWSDALAKSRHVISLARRFDDRHSETYARYRAAFVLIHCGDLADARVEIEANLAAAERLRDRGLLADALYVASLLALLTGAWNEARTHIDRGLSLASEHLPLLHAGVMLEFETGQEPKGRELLQRLLEVDRRAGPYPLAGAYTAITLAQSSVWSGDQAAAAAALSAVRAVLGRTAVTLNAVLTARMARGLVSLLGPHLAEPEEELELLSPFEPVVPMEWGLVTGRLLGLLARAAGHRRRALARFDAALGFCRRCRYLPELARTCYDYAGALLERGDAEDRRRAAALIDESEQVAVTLNMGPLSAQIAMFRQRFHVRLNDKPAGLTARELEILRLLSAGQTNKEIAQTLSISSNTVANHVAHVMAKTGAPNRTGAVAFASRHRLFDAPAQEDAVRSPRRSQS